MCEALIYSGPKPSSQSNQGKEGRFTHIQKSWSTAHKHGYKTGYSAYVLADVDIPFIFIGSAQSMTVLPSYQTVDLLISLSPRIHLTISFEESDWVGGQWRSVPFKIREDNFLHTTNHT